MPKRPPDFLGLIAIGMSRGLAPPGTVHPSQAAALSLELKERRRFRRKLRLIRLTLMRKLARWPFAPLGEKVARRAG